MSLDNIELDTRTQEILLAASSHDLDALEPFLRVPGAASVQDPETGFTPLHAAIAACGQASQNTKINGIKIADAPVNGATNGLSHDSSDRKNKEDEIDIEKAKSTLKKLFLSGAIWNDLDINNETPGCLAWRLGQKELYELVVEAGVRAELLMNLMGGYELLADENSEEEEKVEKFKTSGMAIGEAQPRIADASSTTVLSQSAANPEPSQNETVTSKAYLASTLVFTPFKLLDAFSNGVMMSWEKPIMDMTANMLAPSPGLRILNIGFGLGIIDRLFAGTQPASHHIIEAHPDVLARLQSTLKTSNTVETKEEAEGERVNEVDNFTFFSPSWRAQNSSLGMDPVLHPGTWQTIIPTLLKSETVFDAIYFDTFGESYMELKRFFTEYVVGLLAPDGKFGFFNGLGADRRVCYDVYTRVVECDLLDAGLEVEWADINIDMAGAEGEDGGHCRTLLGKEGEGEWEGVKRRYWTLEKVSVCPSSLSICKSEVDV